MAFVTSSTGSDGAFELRDLPRAPDLMLRIDHPDYVLFRLVNLVAAEKGTDLGNIQLERGAIVSGIVRNADGGPIANALVTFHAEPKDGYFVAGELTRMGGGRSAVSGRSGEYRLGPLSPMSGHVVAESSGYGTGASQRIELASTAMESVDLTLGRTASIRGHVVDRERRPIAGATVIASEEESLVSSTRPKPVEAETDEEGSFELEGLATTLTYGITADARGFTVARVFGVKAQGRDLLIELAESGRITGRVIDAGSRVAVTRFSTTLEASRERWTKVDGVEGKAEIGSDGTFTIDDLDPGSYRVTVTASGYADAHTKPLRVESGRTTEGGELALGAGASIAGRVHAETDQRSIARATLTLSIVEGETEVLGQGKRKLFRDLRELETQADGAFELSGLEPGEYRLRATHPEFATLDLEGLCLERGEQRRDVSVSLTAGGTVQGTVRGADGLPRARAVIFMPNRRAVSDVDGHYRLDHLAAGANSFMWHPAPSEEFDAGKRLLISAGRTSRSARVRC
jgi:protocatechuate 3,4-dioxygenase beta subunit